MGKSISHTGASMGYGWNGEKEAEVVYREHLSGDNPREITQEFKVIQQQNHLCQKNTLSFVLSPTIEDGQGMTNENLNEIVEMFLKEMKLQERQAIGFVHRDKEHTHVHVYVNRIDFNGNAYKDSFIGKRSQQAAEKVAKQMGLTTVKEVQQEKLNQIQHVRGELKRIHDKVMEKDKPNNFDKYINNMAKNGVEVIPSINKQNQLQGFRFEYKGHNLKGSEVHRSMSMGNIAGKMGWDKNVAQKMARENTVKLLGKPVGLSPNLVATIARKVVTIAIKKSIGLGTEI